MDLEHLNRSQIILLTLFVSFITSIATGIVTVTLMDQAPPGVTHTISKVVEHTVEKIVPDQTKGAVTVKTVIIKENDLISKAVEKNRKSLIEIRSVGKDSIDKDGKKLIKGENKFVATGFIVSSNGIVVTDSDLVSDNGEYKVKVQDMDEMDIKVLKQDEEKGVAILKIVNDEIHKKDFHSIIFANSDITKLGQTVVSLSGIGNTTVLTGIISNFKIGTYTKEPIAKDSKVKDSKVAVEKIEYRSGINTNIPVKKINSGSIVLDTDGMVIGMNIFRTSSSYIVPSNIIVDMIATLSKIDSESNPKSKSATSDKTSASK